jgi:class 3 adenylate cyclase
MLAMEPQVRYCTTGDAVCIAYSVMGEGLPLVFASNVFGDLQWYSFNEETRDQVNRLVSAGCQAVRYDVRGMGSSDRDVTDFSLEARVLDLEAVVDGAGHERFALCGYTHGNAAAIAYAARNARRVSHLILVNPYASGAAYYDRIPAARAMIGLRTMAQDDWEFFTLTIANAILGYADSARAQRTAALFRGAVSPAQYVAFTEAAQATDLASTLAAIDVPTLVVVDKSGVGNADLARIVATRIAGARLMQSDDYVDEALAFLGLESGAPVRSVPSKAASMAVILFTDIADSTALTERMGDGPFRSASRKLDDAVRRAMRDAGGTPIEGRVLGDGVLGTFASAAQALAAARGCVEFSAGLGLPLHVGLHAGDVLREADNVYGGAVNIASRICALCEPGEILVSQTVRDLARTSAGVAFEDRGEHALKGIEDAVRIYAVRGGTSPGAE